MKNLNAARDLILLSTRLGECADCETPGVKCATPAGEIQTGDLRLVSVAESCGQGHTGAGCLCADCSEG